MSTATTKPSFGAYLLAFIFPPAYFFSRKELEPVYLVCCFFISLPLLFLLESGLSFGLRMQCGPCGVYAMR